MGRVAKNRNYMFSKLFYIIQILNMKPTDLPLSKLAKNLKVNTTYLREILDILRRAGFITIRRERRGTRGRPPELISITKKYCEYHDIFNVLPEILKMFSENESERKNAEEFCKGLNLILEKWTERE